MPESTSSSSCATPPLAADQAGDPARQEALLRRALQLVDAEADPDRAALIHERLSQSLWSQHRQDDSVEELRAGLALLPDEPSAARAKLLAQFSRRRMVQSRFAEAAEKAREALSVARAVGYREAEAIALNGSARRSVRAARSMPVWRTCASRSRSLARRASRWRRAAPGSTSRTCSTSPGAPTRRSRRRSRGSRRRTRYDWRTTDWLKLSISEFRFHLGDWSGAEEAIPPASRRHTGGTRLYWQTCRAQLALGRGDLEAAEEAIATLAKATADLTEPQFVGMHGILSAELSRRRGDIDAARAVIDDALDRIEFCSEDVVRVAALAVMGLRVEGDAGEAARDRRDAEAEAAARTRADALLERSRLGAQAGLVVEAAQLATSEGEYARATGGDAAGLWATAAERWDALGRPYISAYARWREAEALMAGRDREGASRAASAALASARRLGSAWLAEEVESLAARARLQLGEGAEAAAAVARPESDDPFGLTVRERDVLALVAAGATNREIGERLHMAEKTASVHVSRILAKLNVRSRTEAAAVAHRQGLITTV